MTSGPPVEGLDVTACTIPIDAGESDGTLEWNATTIVVVQAHAGGRTGVGWTPPATPCRASRRTSS